jgi:hypothetical protein
VKFMPSQTIAELIATLTPQQEAAVREFITFLQRRESPFGAVAAQFIAEHAELMQRLAE